MSNFNDNSLAGKSRSRRSMADRLRRGACLLNAAQYDEAIAELEAAVDVEPCADTLESYLASCGFRANIDGRPDERAIEALREAIAEDPENPGLHFQLGALLVLGGRLEEAELRFTQVLSILRDHVETLVCLALCHHMRGELRQGVSLMQRAQALQPGDAKIALLLAQIAKAGKEQGAPVDLCAVVTND